MMPLNSKRISARSFEQHITVLHGNFPCSVCGKVFCHSSSLSRHRMQAHFKSYTCTQCNQEISSNETLRSHMFRVHSISRMFMCRCCNWAFPDKTSLHIHMQSMIKSGTPGDVSVLARSSTEGPGMAGAVGEMSPHEFDMSPSSSPQEGRDSISPVNETPVKLPPFNNNLLNGSIFPALAGGENFFSRFKAKTDALLPQTGTDPTTLLAQWLANNPYATQFASIHAAQMMYAAANNDALNLQTEASDRQSVEGSKMEISDVENRKEDEKSTSFNLSSLVENNGSTTSSVTDVNKILSFIQEAKPSSAGSSLDKLLEKKVAQSSRNKRKASKPQQLPNFLKVDEDGEGQYMGTPPKVSTIENGLEKVEIHVCPPGEQPSPAVSDSHTSGSSSAPSGLDVSSPQKCYDCQMLKAKLDLSESRAHILENKVSNYEAKLGRLESLMTEAQSTVQQYEKDQQDLRNRVETFEKKFIECQEHVVSLMGSLRDGPESYPTIMGMMEDLLKCTMFLSEQTAS